MPPARNLVLESALEYAELGWRVIPCTVETKHPPMKGWQNLATTDEKQLEKWFTGKHKNSGLSIVFGPSSGICDIDVDDMSDGDALCRVAFGGEWPMTPTYLSGTRKTPHRIFCFTPELPDAAHLNLRNTPVGWDVDIKIGSDDKGTHSVAPPSAGYQWVPGLSPTDCSPAVLPDTFIAWLANLESGGEAMSGKPSNGQKPLEHWERIIGGVQDGTRHDDIMSYIGKIVHEWQDISTRNSVAVLMESVRAVNSRFQPSLKDDELDTAVSNIIKRERIARSGDEFREALTPSPEAAVAPKNDTRFRLVIVEGEPPMFELFADEFSRADGGCLRLLAEQLASPRTIVVQAIKQATAGLPATFEKAWRKKGGLMETLLATAERRVGVEEDNRTAVVAQAIQSAIAGAKSSETPDRRGKAVLLPDGCVVFKTSWLVEELKFNSEKIQRAEMTRVLKKAGVPTVRPRVHGARDRYWSANNAKRPGLDNIAWPGPKEPLL